MENTTAKPLLAPSQQEQRMNIAGNDDVVTKRIIQGLTREVFRELLKRDGGDRDVAPKVMREYGFGDPRRLYYRAKPLLV